MKIVLTGGGTAGHVTPNIALVPKLRESGYEIEYIGSKAGIEKDIIEAEGIPYHGVSSGKLRRYLSVKNFADIFRVARGFGDASAALKKTKPDVVFSKGGFVIVPVVLAAKLRGIPVVIHESDITPGLANKIAAPFARAICTSFPEAADKFPKKKVYITGSPIRAKLMDGSRLKGLGICGFSGSKPVILVTGGSLGSVKINTAVRQTLPVLAKDFDIVHICGKGNTDMVLDNFGGAYKQFEYVGAELAHVMQCADIVISRAGANTIFELLALKKPHLLIPLSKNASRGDQILNAESFKKQGFSAVLAEEDLSEDSLANEVGVLYKNRAQYQKAMSAEAEKDAVEAIVRVILEHTKNNVL